MPLFTTLIDLFNSVVNSTGTAFRIDNSIATSTGTVVFSDVVSQTMLASNTARKCFYLYNYSASPVTVFFGTPAGGMSVTMRMVPYSLYESPPAVYTGIVTAIWDTATGGMVITEIT